MINIQKPPVKTPLNAVLRLLRHSLALILIAAVTAVVAFAFSGKLQALIIQMTGLSIGVIWGVLIVAHAEIQRTNEDQPK